ncbi:hypothetical protein [Paenibacillus sp. FSL H7-0331]|uniref:hypothetical protein n=1 Tax=Paenibacillus sp. FSL H7-0331 TaxID=1920421 RepID=UPI002116C9F5|nr:hypothetical protein [Paenibacillus sp. FSL H7-0331]
MFYKEELEPYKKRGQYLMNLRYLNRQHEPLTGMCVQAKLEFQAVLKSSVTGVSWRAW